MRFRRRFGGQSVANDSPGGSSPTRERILTSGRIPTLREKASIMFSLDLLIATVLITSPALPPVQTPDGSLVRTEAIPCPLWSLQSVALSLEVMDRREVGWVFCRPEDYAVDLDMIRQRYRELADAPPLVDASGSPALNWPASCAA